jgi:hypothetical protein
MALRLAGIVRRGFSAQTPGTEPEGSVVVIDTDLNRRPTVIAVPSAVARLWPWRVTGRPETDRPDLVLVGRVSARNSSEQVTRTGRPRG